MPGDHLILLRLISLSFRLYGNVFAGENMLKPCRRWFPPAGCRRFRFTLGAVGRPVQALVFMLLIAVFTPLSCQREEEYYRRGCD
jgi:F-type H+-transporting ATPase subunit a